MKLNFFKSLRKQSGLVFLALPPVLLLFLFNYVPLYGLILPFKNYNYDLGFFRSPWSGFANFEFLFTSQNIYIITRNTILYNLTFIFAGTFFSVIAAAMLYELLNRKITKLYQTVMFFPYFLSWIVVSYIVLALLDSKSGLFNQMITIFGGEAVFWYGNLKAWPFILVFVAVWKGLGYGSAIFYAALLGIDVNFYESARIDGANRFQQLWHISLPIIKPVIVMIVILQMGRIFYSDFGLFYNVTRNSVLIYPVTDVIDTYVYRTLKNIGDIGMASAVGFYQSLVGFMLVVATNFVVKKIDEESSLF